MGVKRILNGLVQDWISFYNPLFSDKQDVNATFQENYGTFCTLNT